MPVENARLIDHLLTRSARRLPDKPFLEDHTGAVVTYGQADAMAWAFARRLAADGVGRGDRVVILAHNRVQVPLAAMGVSRADGVFVILNPSTPADKLAYVLSDCAPTAMVVDGNTGPKVWKVLAAKGLEGLPVYDLGGRALGSVPGGRWVTWDDATAGGSTERPRAALDVDLAALVYTSGSTGRPKGVMLTHRNLRHTTWSISTYLENREDDVILSALPLAFDYGMYQALCAMRVGATLLLEPHFAMPYPVLRRMEERGVTGFPGVPTMFALILAMKDLSRFRLPRLRYVTNTADALPVAHIEALRAAFPHVTIYSMYGLTECTRVSYLDPMELDRRPGSVGRAIPNTEVWVQRADGTRAGPWEEGILYVRGSHVMSGYWNDPEATDRVLEPGPLPGERVLRTGDVFVQDEAGFLYFRRRTDDIIKTRGEKVSPREVEDVLHAHPEVLQAAVVGLPDPILGQRIVAFVVPRPGASPDRAGLMAHLKANLEDYMVPSRLLFRPELPKTPSGKVARRALAQELIGGHD